VGNIAESNRWYRGKGKLIRDHIDKQKMMNDLIASKGFCIAPGYLGEAITDLEENTKIRLSDLNYEIVKEAVERELKQKGIYYDLAYKQARIDFELDKTVLLTDLQKEFADLDYTQAKKEEEVEYLAIEAHIRSFTLIVLKQAIREEMELLKQELMNVKRLTFNHENLLLEARIATAENKLNIIPYLEQIVDAENRFLAQENINLGHKESEIEEKEALTDAKEELITVIEEKADANQDLADAITNQVAIQEQRLGVALSRAEAQKDKVNADLMIIDAEREIELLRKELNQAAYSLKETQMARQIAMTREKAKSTLSVSTKEVDIVGRIDDFREDVSSYRRDTDKSISDIGIEADEYAVAIGVDADLNSMWKIRAENNRRTRKTAEIAAAISITSKLVHLLAS
jgi:hypothetical protein